MKVPFVDFSKQYEAIKKEIEPGLQSIFQKGNFILGQEEKDFESEFAKYCEARYAIGVNSGTDALFLALLALGVGEGDEVIVPSFTFIATALAVSYTRARPVFADIQEGSYNINPEEIKKKITPRTKVIIAVHLYGQPADMQEILTVAGKHNIKVLEDSAQAHGAVYRGRRVGSLGDVGCFSFYPTKGLGAFGDGGMVVTQDKSVYDRVLSLRDYGRKDRYAHVLKGYNSRLDTVQAVVLSAKLKHLDEWNQMRRDHAMYYAQLLKSIPGVKTPVVQAERTHVFQTFAIRVEKRDKVYEEMKRRDVGALIHYPIPLHLQEAYSELGYKPGDFPVSERIAKEILSVPMYPHVQKEQIQYVCDCLKEATGS
ncbi:MAG: DegT/DnrJ/EryC1/StrS family aminotransferase [Candidatus Omnitrophota bacterium]